MERSGGCFCLVSCVCKVPTVCYLCFWNKARGAQHRLSLRCVKCRGGQSLCVSSSQICASSVPEKAPEGPCWVALCCILFQSRVSVLRLPEVASSAAGACFGGSPGQWLGVGAMPMVLLCAPGTPSALALGGGAEFAAWLLGTSQDATG